MDKTKIRNKKRRFTRKLTNLKNKIFKPKREASQTSTSKTESDVPSWSRVKSGRLSKFSDRLPSFLKSSKFRKSLFWILIAAVSIVVGINTYRYFKERSDKVTVSITSIQVYMSRSSRDEDKKEQYSFSPNDPIQGKFKYKNADNGTVILYKVVNDDDEIQKVEIPLDGEGERYVTMSPAPWEMEEGTYRIEISQGGYTLKTAKFTIK